MHAAAAKPDPDRLNAMKTVRDVLGLDFRKPRSYVRVEPTHPRCRTRPACGMGTLRNWMGWTARSSGEPRQGFEA